MIDIKRIKKRITGSLAGLIALMMIIIPQAALAASSHSEMSGLAEPQGVSEVNAAAGVVRIETGTNDDDGNFKAKYAFSGFVVSEAGNGSVFILTTWHNVNLGQNTIVHVIVKNDTAVEAGVESYSEEQDFCILSAGSMNGKEALPLRVTGYDEEGDKLSDGAGVRALGFGAKAASGTEFSASDVIVNNGTVKSIAQDINSATYISHTADLSGGLDGGPLVDEYGYVIGINNSKVSGDEGSFALQIQEADKLLDSNGITHRTKDKAYLYSSLYNLCDESLSNYKKVKKEYQDDLKEAITAAIKVMGESPYDRSALQNSINSLKNVMDKAELKTSKLVYLIIALGALIAFLTARLVTLITWNRRYEADNPDAVSAKKQKKQKPAKSKPQKAVDPSPQKAAASSPQKAAPVRSVPERVMPAVVPQSAPVNEAYEKAAKLLVRRTGAVYEVRKNVVTIGRSRDADICIADNEYIAKTHVMIENRKGTYFIHDMGSINGTYINGQPVTSGGMRIITGDVISVANEVIDFI